MSSPIAPSPGRSRLWLKVFILLVVLVVAGVLTMRGLDLKALAVETAERIRGLGPGLFFTAMAVLPAVGFPFSIFMLSAGPVFGPTLGVPLVIALTAVSLATNLALSYWLAHYALRPWIERLLRWLGYTLPAVAPENRLALTILVRVTPGPPYFLQSFVLGLVAIPFSLYLVVSWSITMAYATAAIVFGDSLMRGNGRYALAGLGLFLAVAAIVMLIRRKLAGRKESVS